MTANTELVPVKESPWMRGFSNLFRKENRAWWCTRRWWINALLWPVILCGLLANILFVPTIANLAPEAEVALAGSPDAYVLKMGLNVFFEFGITALAIGVVILVQGLIISEKGNGISEWLLSKPITKRSYLLSKLAANLIPVLVFMIGLPSTLAYLLLSIRHGSVISGLDFLTGVAIMTLHTIFYLSLTLMLGVLFNNRGPVLGLSLGSILGGNLLAGMIKPLLYISPWILPKYASLAASGQGFPAQLGIAPLIATAVEIVAFIVIGIAIFDKSEY